MKATAEISTSSLRIERQTAESANHTEHIVVRSVYRYRAVIRYRSRIEYEIQVDRVNLAAVERTGWLLFFRAQTEAVKINVVVRDVRMALKGLDDAKIQSVATFEAVIAIQLNQGRCHRILQVTTDVWARTANGLIEVRKVHPLMSLLHTILLNDPDELLAAVIEDEWDVHRGDVTGYRMRWGILELIDQILVVRSNEAFTFIRVQIDVVTKEL